MYINKIKKIQQNFKNHLLKINNKESDSKKKYIRIKIQNYV